VSALAFAPPATQPQSAAAAAVLGRCPQHPSRCRRRRSRGPPIRPGIQAPFLYRGSGPAVVVRSALAPYAGPRGDEVTVQCGTRVSRRTVVVDL
jgi:hypothetical protein